MIAAASMQPILKINNLSQIVASEQGRLSCILDKHNKYKKGNNHGMSEVQYRLEQYKLQ